MKSSATGKKTLILRNLHQAAGVFFRASKFRWELIDAQGGKIGIWRKAIRPRISHRRKTFLVVPGFGDTPMSWFPLLALLLPRLVKNYDEIAVLDFPGFNGFLHNEKAYDSMDRFLRAGQEVIAYVAPHTILGHSLGGWLSAHYACSQELQVKRLQKLILISPTGAFESRKAGLDWRREFMKMIEDRDFSIWRPKLFAKEPVWFHMIASEFSRFLLSEENIQFMLSAKERHLVQKNLPKMKAQAWLIWGDNDRLIPVSSMKGWIKHLPPESHKPEHAIVYKGVGHSPQVEALGRMVKTIGQIIDAKPRRKLSTRPLRTPRSKQVTLKGKLPSPELSY